MHHSISGCRSMQHLPDASSSTSPLILKTFYIYRQIPPRSQKEQLMQEFNREVMYLIGC